MILTGLTIFLVGTVFCLFATSYTFILIGRFCQGIGVASPAILSFLIIADNYPLKQQQFYMAILNGVMNTAAAIAPVIGSYLTLYFHWQGNFTALFLLGLWSLLMTIFFIPRYKIVKNKEPVSFCSYFTLLKSKRVMLFITCLAVLFSPYWFFVGISPLLYINDLGVSLAHFGYYQGSFAFTFGLGSIVFGYIISKHNQIKWLRIAVGIFLIGLICLALVTFIGTTSALAITLSFMPFNIGLVIPSVILYPLCLQIKPEAKGRLSALLQGSRLVFTSISLQIAGYFYNHSFFNIGVILMTLIIISSLLLLFVMKDKAL